MSEIAIEGVRIKFGHFWAVDNVSLTVPAGKTIGLVGESGCGKSTLAKAVVGLVQPNAGSIRVDGLSNQRRGHRKLIRAKVQMVFQDARAALNPRMSASELVSEALSVRTAGQGRRQVRTSGELLELVRLPSTVGRRYPRDLSGGQCQRVAIARALAVDPAFLVLDEVTSGLDVSVQAAVLNLLADLQAELGLGCLFISHNLAVVKVVSDYVAVMRKGAVVESGETEEVLGDPKEPYTRVLIQSVPGIERVS